MQKTSKIDTALVTSRGWKNHTQGKFGFYLSFINHYFLFILFGFHGFSQFRFGINSTGF